MHCRILQLFHELCMSVVFTFRANKERKEGNENKTSISHTTVVYLQIYSSEVKKLIKDT